MMGYLWHQQVPLTAFGKHAVRITKQVKDSSLAEAERQQRPIQYFPSGKTGKKTLAEQIAKRDKIDEGLIGVFSCVEPCLSSTARCSRAFRLLSTAGRSAKANGRQTWDSEGTSNRDGCSRPW